MPPTRIGRTSADRDARRWWMSATLPRGTCGALSCTMVRRSAGRPVRTTCATVLRRSSMRTRYTRCRSRSSLAPAGVAWAAAMPTIQCPATTNTTAKSASPGTACRAICWMAFRPALAAVAIGGAVGRIRSSMITSALWRGCHSGTCKRRARRRRKVHFPVCPRRQNRKPGCEGRSRGSTRC